MSIGEKIKEIALKDIGQEEIRGNKGFKDPKFQERMEEAGFEEGHSWCLYYCEDVWKQAFPDSMQPILDKLFSANAVKTWENFWNSDFITSSTPVVGAIAMYIKRVNGQASFVGNTEWKRGHGCIVSSFDDEGFTSIDGNSNDDGSREGYEVVELNKNYDFKVENGLELLGFVHPVLKKKT